MIVWLFFFLEIDMARLQAVSCKDTHCGITQQPSFPPHPDMSHHEPPLVHAPNGNKLKSTPLRQSNSQPRLLTLNNIPQLFSSRPASHLSSHPSRDFTYKYNSFLTLSFAIRNTSPCSTIHQRIFTTMTSNDPGHISKYNIAHW